MNLHTNTFDLVLTRLKRKASDYLQFHLTTNLSVCFLRLLFLLLSSDIDECAEGIHNCSPHAFCNNTKGSYYCTCKPGFTGNVKVHASVNFCTH